MNSARIGYEARSPRPAMRPIRDASLGAKSAELATWRAVSEVRTAVVTGSSGEIGHAVAERLAAAGMNLVLHSPEPGDAIEPRCEGLEERFGIRAVHATGNLSKPNGARKLIAAADSAFGRVDVLVNVVNMATLVPAKGCSDKAWDLIIAHSLSASFHAIQGVLEGMKARNWGRIVNVTSVPGLFRSSCYAAYETARRGVISLTKTLAQDVAKDGVTVNAVCPEQVWTPLSEEQIRDTAWNRCLTREEVIRDVLQARQPSRSLVTAGQIAQVTAFLSSDAAATITGTVIAMGNGSTER
ncbi:MAG: SDR family oxidoreductase [Rhodobacteraceae bacterium]|nr:SDR family oxidoreductase [Paracoccaceae bacterium]